MYKLLYSFQIGLALWGLFTVLYGVVIWGSLGMVRGWRARLLGAIAMLPRPLGMAIGFILALSLVYCGWTPKEIGQWIGRIGVWTELALVVGTLLTMHALAKAWSADESTANEPASESPLSD